MNRSKLSILAAVILTALLGVSSSARASSGFSTVYDNIRYSNGNWQGFRPPAQPPDECCGAIGVASDASNNSTHVDVTTISGLWDNIRYSNGAWQGWERPVQPYGLIQHLAEAGDVNGNIWYVAATTTGLYYTDRLASTGGWSRWTPVDYGALPGTVNDLAFAVDVWGNLQIMIALPGGAIWHCIYYRFTASWQGWAQPAGVPGGAWSIAAAGQNNGEVQFIAVNENGIVYHDIRYNSGSWQGWAEPPQPPGGAADGSVSAAVDGDGEAQFTLQRPNGDGTVTFFHTIRDPGGNWESPWGAPARPPGTAGQHCSRLVVTAQSFRGGPFDFHFDTYCQD